VAKNARVYFNRADDRCRNCCDYGRNCLAELSKSNLPFNESPTDGTTKYYDLTLVVAQSSYTLSAAPKGAQSGDSCGTLGVAHTGAKTHSGGSNCW